MATIKQFKTEGLNLALSPLLSEGQVLHALNVKRDTFGGWKKREGYTTFLGTPDSSRINSLFSWTKNSGTETFVYRASGNILYHSLQGTGVWTISGNGTISSGAPFGYAVLEDILIGGDGTLASRHSTTGTNFVDTTGAPLAEHWAEYQSRAWAARNNDLFFSTVGTATDWTTDSSSFRVSGPGGLNSLFKAGDRLVTSQNSGNIVKWNGDQFTDLATNFGPSSPYSVGNIEDYRIYLNKQGFMGFSGAKPQTVSSAVQRQIFNDAGSGIAGTTFSNARGIGFKHQYYCSVGTVTDDLIYQTIPDCVMRYDLQFDEWVNWKFANRPTAFGSYQDASGNEQLIFGDASGQCYRTVGTLTSDNGNAIESGLIGFISGNSLESKDWSFIRGLFNPGCRAMVAFALSDTFTPRTLNWTTIGDAKDGIVEYKFPSGSRGVFLFWRILESSTDQPWQFYGWEWDAQIVKHG